MAGLVPATHRLRGLGFAWEVGVYGSPGQEPGDDDLEGLRDQSRSARTLASMGSGFQTRTATAAVIEASTAVIAPHH